MSFSKQTKGFTLIELVVVIAVMTVLAGLLIPAVANSREKANKAKCLANLRQISAANAIYYTELINELPEVDTSDRFCSSSLGEAIGLLMPYIGRDSKLFQCPSNQGTERCRDFTEIRGTNPKEYSEYEMNSNLLTCQRQPGRKQSGIVEPSRAVLVFDFPFGDSACAQIAHEGGVNCGYVDGHAAWLSDTNFFVLTTNAFFLRGIDHP